MGSAQFLRLLCEESGLSGYEGKVCEVVKTHFGELCDDVRVDGLGNCIGLKLGEGPEPRPKILLAAHMDEVGLVVTKLERRGFVRFALNSVDQRTVPAAEVVIHAKRDIPGIVCVKPPHLLKTDERSKSYKVEDLAISTGLGDEELQRLVRPGDPVSMVCEYTQLLNRNVAAKALDDRAGVAVIYECLQNLSRMRHKADVYAVATVQEETGFRGATVASYGIKPDIGVAIDVGFGDQPGVPEDRKITLDKGPSIDLGPNVHPVLHDRLTEIAKRHSIPYQNSIIPGVSGTDAWAIQVSRAGVPCAILSIPSRNMHTRVEIVNLNDISRAARLLAEFVLDVDEAFTEGLVWS